MVIFKSFTLDMAHRLPNVPAGHKCGNIHGHTFTVKIYVRGPIHEQFGWIMDFADLAAAFEPLRAQLDHCYLNDIEGLENPTSEHLAKWIWDRLKPSLPILCKIVVQESPHSGCIYSGEEE
ncbi:MAG TPA: 6-carboxytetrahydropterin synthase QueD [Syntrophorhabdaceae bacterium]